MNAGVDTVGGVSLPPAWIVKIDGTRTFVAPEVAAGPVVFGGLLVVVTALCVVVIVVLCEELVPPDRDALEVELECFDPPHPPSRRSDPDTRKTVHKRLIL